MAYDIVFETCPWHTRVALFNEQGRLLSLRFDEETRPLIEGAIVLGRVRRVAPSLKAAFVDIGDVEDGFLKLSTVPKSMGQLTEGQEIMVRVTRGSDMHKGARLDARVPFSEVPEGASKAPCILRRAPTALRRSLMDSGDTPVRCWVKGERDIQYVGEYVEVEKIHRLDQSEDVELLDMLDEQLDGIYDTEYRIPGGAVTVEITKALSAIDVDAKNIKNHPQAIVEFNKSAADEIVRLCGLLDLGGNIIIDFVGMNKRQERDAVTEHLQHTFAQHDMAQVEVFPMSRFCLSEINRERGGAMLPQLLAFPTFVAGRILLDLWRLRGQRVGEIYVDALPEVIDVLKQRLTTDACLAYLGCPVVLNSRTSGHPTDYSITTV